jgi:hypothetical protein
MDETFVSLENNILCDVSFCGETNFECDTSQGIKNLGNVKKKFWKKNWNFF